MGLKLPSTSSCICSTSASLPGAAIQQYAAIKAKVEAMMAAGRDPTDEQWTGLLDVVDELLSRLNAAANRPKTKA